MTHDKATMRVWESKTDPTLLKSGKARLTAAALSRQRVAEKEARQHPRPQETALPPMAKIRATPEEKCVILGMKYGNPNLTQQDIARMTGRTQSFVSNLLSKHTVFDVWDQTEPRMWLRGLLKVCRMTSVTPTHSLPH